MHVAVLGAGVVGVASAWYLAKAGHRVTVIESNAGPALGTSYGNAGQISPALSSPWAFPGLVRKAIAFAMADYSPLVLSRVPDAEMARFLVSMWRAATPAQYADAKRRMVIFAEYSRDCFRALRREVDIDYAGRQLGLVVAFREAKQVEGYEADLAVLDRLDVPYRRLKADDVFGLEPNLARDAGIVGGVHLETDETGDCFRFTNALARLAAERGVEFRYATDVASLRAEGGRVRAAVTAAGEIEADAFVLALGVGSKALAATLGERLPVYPVKGYSLTIAADPDAVGPRATVLDESYKVGLTHLGDRIRVGGTAELVGYDLSRPEARYAGLIRSLRTLFPRVPEAAIASAERWSGLRPVTPAGPPIVGSFAGHPNLYVNSGHGTLGWTMSLGSGSVVADLISGRPTAVDIASFRPGPGGRPIYAATERISFTRGPRMKRAGR